MGDTGEVVFSTGGGGGGVNRAPPKLGFRKRAQLTGPLISYYELWRRRRPKLLSMRVGQFFFPSNTGQMMTFLNPLDALIPRIPFSFSVEFWVWVTSAAWGSR